MSATSWEMIQSLVERAMEMECLQGEEMERERVRDRLFSALRPQVHHMIRAMVADSHLVEDITQDALLHLWHWLRSYNPKLAPFRAWASRVVINFTYNAVRNYHRAVRHEVRESDWKIPDLAEEPLPAFEHAADPAPDPSDQAGDRERLELILQCARETLSTDEYLVWLEQVINGTSYQDIAALMERNESWVRQTMLRARQRLAAAMVLHSKILSDEEIQNAITRCQRSEEPLSEAEIHALREALPPGGARKPPGWRQINLFRQACYKLLPHLLGCLLLLLAHCYTR
ncbi:MAG: sigma-70 family RNA polymerase sigma factor [Fimbriimonadales bacterium]|nr:sigma-70 family RNA polymerase sigma factor [Fimbriimonadales bacterium]